MSLPVGSIIGIIGVNPDMPPDGWLYCNGGTFDAARYDELARIFSNNVLPNLVGLSLIGASRAGGSYPPSSEGVGTGKQQNANGTYGSESHTLSLQEMPSHQHFGFGERYDGWPFGVLDANQPGSKGAVDSDNYYFGTSFSGGKVQNGTTASENSSFGLIQPSYAIYFFIRATSRDAADV